MATDKLGTVRKLLAMADNASTPAEAQTFAERAAALMARHGIDETLARAAAPEQVEDPVERKTFRLGNPYAHERGNLLWAVGAGFGCTVLWGKFTATIYGHRSDIARAELLYTALLLTIAGPMTAPVDTSWCWDAREAAGQTRMWRKSWLTGFGNGIYHRMMRERRAAVADADQRAQDEGASSGTGAELVLVSRDAAVAQLIEKTVGKTFVHKPRKLDDDAVRAGARAARSADLGTDPQVAAASSRRALS